MKSPSWTHHQPVWIRFQPGCLGELPGHTPPDPILLVTSPGMTKRGVTHRVQGLLEGKTVTVHDEVGPNPTIESIEAAREEYIPHGIKGIVAIGGGSVLDTAKSLALLLTPPNQNVPLDDHFYQGRPLREETPLPLVAVPTTAGTGSEVTPFATLWDADRKKKQSLTTHHMHPTTALLDPELTKGLPPEVALPSGFDALSHALESVWNHNATPITRMYATRAVRLILENLPNVIHADATLHQRSRMLEGSLLAGLAIATTRTALAHSISYPLTSHYGLPHGYACSFTLPALLRYNAKVDDGRLKALAGDLGHNGTESLAAAIEQLYHETGATKAVQQALPGKAALAQHIDEMFTPQRAGNNMRRPDEKDVEGILEESTRLLYG
jgi:alcohol dehydrogenase